MGQHSYYHVVTRIGKEQEEKKVGSTKYRTVPVRRASALPEQYEERERSTYNEEGVFYDHRHEPLAKSLLTETE